MQGQVEASEGGLSATAEQGRPDTLRGRAQSTREAVVVRTD